MKYYLFIICSLLSICLYAQESERKIELKGYVMDAFTQSGIPNVKVYLMTTDSTVVDTASVKSWKPNGNMLNSQYLFHIPAVNLKYILKAECDNYTTGYAKIVIKHIARVKQLDAPTIQMSRIRRERGLDKDNLLDDVVVQATKIKVFYKGDTLVYNADAFNLPEGSMLDGLIKQMPGARIEDNGVIYINGRKIDYLTLNGKKLFDGDAQVISQNLPYYTVKDLKVFEQTKETEIGLNDTTGIKDYVMNVNLKKEYVKNNFGNVQAGIGTNNRRLLRAFDNYSSDAFSTMAFANLNNVNQTRIPGSNGTFKDRDAPRSILDTKQFGASMMYEKDHGTFANIMNVRGLWQGTESEMQQSSTTYLPSNDVFKKIMNSNNTDRTFIDFNNRTNIITSSYFQLQTIVQYEREKGNTDKKSATFNESPTGDSSFEELFDAIRNGSSVLRNSLVNHSASQSHANSHALALKEFVNMSRGLSWGDDVLLHAHINYDEGKNKTNEDNSITYLSSSMDSLYQYWANENLKTKGYEFGGEAFYKFNFLSGLNLQFGYRFIQNNTSIDRLFYKDGLEDNSYHGNTMRRENKPSLSLNYTKGKLKIALDLSLRFLEDKMRYTREGMDTTFYRNYKDIFPALRIIWKAKRSRVEFYNKYESYQKPSITDLVGIVDDADPLWKLQGNWDLKKERMYDYQFMYNYDLPASGFSVYFTSQSQFTFDYIVRTTLYDEKEGSYTISPRNINNGVWASTNLLSVEKTLNKKKTLRLKNDVTYLLMNDANMTGTVAEGLEKIQIKIRNLMENLSLSYQHKRTTIGLSASVSYNGSHSSTGSVHNAYDFQYGGNISCYLPWNIQFSSDVSWFDRHGYELESINKSSLIANLLLSRTFMNGKIIVQAKMYDVFHQLSSIERMPIGQSLKETSYKCIPRYAMVSLTYRFGKNK